MSEDTIKISILTKLFHLVAQVIGLDIKSYDARVKELQEHPERYGTKLATITDEYREIKWESGTSPRLYAYQVLSTMLPKFKSRDDALNALALCYPLVSKENALMKISAALYFTRSEHKHTKPPSTTEWE